MSRQLNAAAAKSPMTLGPSKRAVKARPSSENWLAQFTTCLLLCAACIPTMLPRGPAALLCGLMVALLAAAPQQASGRQV